MRRHRGNWWVFGIAALIVIGWKAPAAGQAPDVLTALLSEVRGLRVAMEQLASAAPRVQLAMGRLQLQEQRVNAMVRRLDEVRDRLAGAERQVNEHRELLARFEKSAAGPDDPEDDEQQAIKAMVAQAKGALERASAEAERLRQEENSLTAAVGQEQARWIEINNALNELDRALGTKR